MPVSAAQAFARLQATQKRHDENHHADIWQLPPARSVTHMVLHQAKYLGGLITAAAKDDNARIDALIVDAFVITLATANILGQDLAATGMPGGITDLKMAGTSLARTLDLDGRDLRSITDRYAQINGGMAKACEALDHMEDYPSRRQLLQGNADLCHLLPATAAVRGIELELAYAARIKAVEARSAFAAPKR